ncbi:hypothetical protein O9H85_27540 [Paenibacillus filicis]|uniref:Major facilitator superfamily (MFS) profile domain-containing protein n=1 Tax=Paenibacillus gyeongsangnamensis TaxID=3388067 RepID=A0ABT4QGW0_9BACL|nr:hypothetical protein [Paenibacillus filicis]MCZ8516089.1 hypothetical protein [Paenibacillus filicis]
MFYMCLAEYVNLHVTTELKASGQMANAVIIQRISKIVGNLLGGVSASMIGLQSTFLINSIICLAAVALFWIMAQRLKENDSYVGNRG